MSLQSECLLPSKPSFYSRFSKTPPLPKKFYLRDTVTVARDLLGKGLWIGQGTSALLIEIAEVEAYLGEGKDAASHSFPGPTPRNAPMFLEGGVCYVYLIYGMHLCLNVVTEKAGIGAAVLLRAGIPLLGEAQMLRNRGLKLPVAPKTFLGGPGKLAEALGIDRTMNSVPFQKADFRIIDLGKKLAKQQFGHSPRIGITKAQNEKFRFYLRDCPWVSGSKREG